MSEKRSENGKNRQKKPRIINDPGFFYPMNSIHTCLNCPRPAVSLLLTMHETTTENIIAIDAYPKKM